jgi:hypothetical protein
VRGRCPKYEKYAKAHKFKNLHELATEAIREKVMKKIMMRVLLQKKLN